MAGAREVSVLLLDGEKLPAAEQEVRREEDTGEDGDGEGAGGGEVDSGEAEEGGFEKGPDGEGRGGVEVSGDVPVAALEVANGCIAVPAFVGVFGPVHPGGVVGEVGVEMDGVKGEEEGGDQEESGLGEFEDAGRDGVRVVHEALVIKHRFGARVSGYYRSVTGGGGRGAIRAAFGPGQRWERRVNGGGRMLFFPFKPVKSETNR